MAAPPLAAPAPARWQVGALFASAEKVLEAERAQLPPWAVVGLGFDGVPLYCDLDGTFPNHHPDPLKEKNLADLKRVVREEAQREGASR